MRAVRLNSYGFSTSLRLVRVYMEDSKNPSSPPSPSVSSSPGKWFKPENARSPAGLSGLGAENSGPGPKSRGC